MTFAGLALLLNGASLLSTPSGFSLNALSRLPVRRPPITSVRGARSMVLSSVRMSVVRSLVADTGKRPPSAEAISSGRMVTPSFFVVNVPAVVTTMADNCARMASSFFPVPTRSSVKGTPFSSNTIFTLL